jgi:hypothetical protein
LRYQPRPLEIPADIRVARKRNFMPLAIAAAVALFVIGAGLWFKLSRSQSSPPFQAVRDTRFIPREVQTPQSPQQTQVATGPEQSTAPRSQPKRTQVAAYKHREPRVAPRAPELTPEEIAEREQVLVALRLVSAKLNLAQRKVQGLPQKNIFRNQNRIG